MIAGPPGAGHEPPRVLASFPMTPHRSRLDPGRSDAGEILRRHRRSVEAGVDAYRDPATGFFVFTAAYLDARGYCCDNDCRHCPYLDRDARLVDEARTMGR